MASQPGGKIALCRPYQLALDFGRCSPISCSSTSSNWPLVELAAGRPARGIGLTRAGVGRPCNRAAFSKASQSSSLYSDRQQVVARVMPTTLAILIHSTNTRASLATRKYADRYLRVDVCGRWHYRLDWRAACPATTSVIRHPISLVSFHREKDYCSSSTQDRQVVN